MREILSAGDGEYVLSEKEQDEVRKIARERFCSWEWIYGSSKQADFVRTRKLPCGTVEAHICTEGGIITDIRFGGDFLGGLASEAVSEHLKGCRFTKNELAQRLSQIEVSAFFDSTYAEDLLLLMFE